MEVLDTAYSLSTAKAIVNVQTMAITLPDRFKKGLREGKDGKRYSKYGIGLPMLLVPSVFAGKGLAFLTGAAETLAIPFMVSFYNVVFGAGTCVIVFYAVRMFRGSDRRALAAALMLGAGTLCWRYSVWDFSEMAQAFFLMLSVYCLLRGTGSGLVTASLSFGFLVLLKAVYLVYVPVFLAYIIFSQKRGKESPVKNAAIFSSGILVALGILFALNYARFGNVLEFGYGEEAKRFAAAGAWRHAAALLFSLNKGLFVYSPVLLLGLLGYPVFFRKRPKEAVFFAALIVVNLAVSSMWHSWVGGWSWGPRFLVPVIPLWLIPCCFLPGLKGRMILRTAAAVLILISLLIQVVSVLQKGLEYHLISYNMVGREKMPADIIGSAIILRHKILHGDNRYHLSEFGVPEDRVVDTGDFETYRGFNLWSCHLARHMANPKLKYIPIVFLPLMVICLILLVKRLRI